MMNLLEIFKEQSSSETARTLCAMYDSKDNARATVIMLKAQIPMYKGNLNPEWKFWNDVLDNIFIATEDEHRKWLLERIQNTPSVPKPKQLKLGEKAYYIEYNRGTGYGKLTETSITKVGRIYFETSDSARRIEKATMLNGHESDPHKRYFLSQQDYDNYLESKILKDTIQDCFRNSWEWKRKLSFDQLKRIVEIIK